MAYLSNRKIALSSILGPYLFLVGSFLMFGCQEFKYDGWVNQPIPITLAQNTPVLQLRFNGSEPMFAAIDTLSPLTIIPMQDEITLPQIAPTNEQSTYEATTPASPQEFIKIKGELRLQDGQFPSITRFRFPEVEVFQLSLPTIKLSHPIFKEPLAVNSLLGVSVLSHFVLHLSYAADSLLGSSFFMFKDDIPDSNFDLASDCDISGSTAAQHNPMSCYASFSTPPIGGGLMRINDQDFDVPATRIVIPVCLMPDPIDELQSPKDPKNINPSGIDVLAVLATGLGTSIISQSALARLQSQWNIQEEGHTILNLPYGQEEASIIHVERLALVADEANDLSACGELSRRIRLFQSNNSATPLLAMDQEKNGASVAFISQNITYAKGAVPAMKLPVAFMSQPIEFAVLPDDSPLLQGLRKELMPYVNDIDILLGGSVLQFFEMDVDYPQNRLILQCNRNDTTCDVFPFCSFQDYPICPAFKNPNG
jgi:hypothetical protein